jgi:hypothetical protein
VDKIIPKPSARITLLRDPVDVFESGYVYMELEKNFRMDINQYAQYILRKGFPPRRLKGKVTDKLIFNQNLIKKKIQLIINSETINQGVIIRWDFNEGFLFHFDSLESGNGRSSGQCPLTSNGYKPGLETVLPPLDLFLQCFKKMSSM